MANHASVEVAETQDKRAVEPLTNAKVVYHLWYADNWQVDYFDIQRETAKSYLLTDGQWFSKAGGEWFTTRAEAYAELLKRCEKDCQKEVADRVAYMMDMIREAAQSEETWRADRR